MVNMQTVAPFYPKCAISLTTKSQGRSVLQYNISAPILNVLLLHQSRFFEGIIGTQFASLELKIVSLESEKIIVGSLESEKSGPYTSIPGI